MFHSDRKILYHFRFRINWKFKRVKREMECLPANVARGKKEFTGETRTKVRSWWHVIDVDKNETRNETLLPGNLPMRLTQPMPLAPRLSLLATPPLGADETIILLAKCILGIQDEIPDTFLNYNLNMIRSQIILLSTFATKFGNDRLSGIRISWGVMQMETLSWTGLGWVKSITGKSLEVSAARYYFWTNHSALTGWRRNVLA